MKPISEHLPRSRNAGLWGNACAAANVEKSYSSLRWFCGVFLRIEGIFAGVPSQYHLRGQMDRGVTWMDRASSTHPLTRMVLTRDAGDAKRLLSYGKPCTSLKSAQSYQPS